MSGRSALLLLAACGVAEPARDARGGPFSAAERLFRSDPRWLGADAALSIPLADDRILWLFGDTFVATSEPATRRGSKMVRNSIGIQHGTDPLRAQMTFHWRRDAGGGPASFFPERGERWFWPGHGLRLDDGPLVLFLYGIVASDEGLGFASAGYGIAIVDDPDAPPSDWDLRFVEGPPLPFDALPATAVLRDGEYLIALAIRQQGEHAGALVRHPAAALARGDLGQADWWCGPARGWVRERDVGPQGPEFVLDDAGAECSLHWEPRLGAFVHVASAGFGATTIALRTAPALIGPWSSPREVYRPPESLGPRPFVYAAKAHPELVGPDAADLLVTYATNSFAFGDLFTPHGEQELYWPRVVRLRLR